MKAKYTTNCPFCRKESTIEYETEQLEAYQRGASIIEAFPSMNSFERELMISGICFECQEKTFNTPMPGNEAAWGESLGECECCGASLWEKDRKEDGSIVCPSCYCPQGSMGE